MSEPDVAIAFSAEEWVEALHHHLIHRGGARVRRVVVEPDAFGDPDFEVLVASYRWPGLTAGLVDELHARGIRVLGVGDPQVPASASILRACGVDAVAGADERPEVLVALATQLARRSAHAAAPPVAPGRAAAPCGERVPTVVVGGPAGAGSTEVAIGVAGALACRVAARGARSCGRAARRAPQGVALVDLDAGGGVGCRLALDPVPDLAMLVEAVEHARRAPACLQPVAPGLGALVAAPGATATLFAPEVARAVTVASAGRAVVVCDVGAAPGSAVGGGTTGRPATGLVARPIIISADVLLAVGDGSPAGVAALVRWIMAVQAMAPGVPCVAVVNRLGRGGTRPGPLRSGIPWPASVVAVRGVPHDPRLARAAWVGERTRHGPFARAMRRLAEPIAAVRSGSGATMPA